MSDKSKYLSEVDAQGWEQWREPGHFIGAKDCRFSLHTHVGRFCVSTVGEYVPPRIESMLDLGYDGVSWHRIGAGDHDYYETMVFPLDEHNETADWSGLDCARYATREAAGAGHLAMCEQYAAKKGWHYEPDPEWSVVIVDD